MATTFFYLSKRNKATIHTSTWRRDRWTDRPVSILLRLRPSLLSLILSTVIGDVCYRRWRFSAGRECQRPAAACSNVRTTTEQLKSLYSNVSSFQGLCKIPTSQRSFVLIGFLVTHPSKSNDLQHGRTLTFEFALKQRDEVGQPGCLRQSFISINGR